MPVHNPISSSIVYGVSVAAGFRGNLYKKAGGKAFEKKRRVLDRWTKRWFVLPPGGTVLSYYRSEQAQMEGQAALGSLELHSKGASVFLKEVRAGQIYRFTVRAMSRELKLRAMSAGDYDAWMGALLPITGEPREEDDMDMSGLSMRDEDDDAEFDDDDVVEDGGGEAGFSAAPNFSLAARARDDSIVGVPVGMRGCAPARVPHVGQTVCLGGLHPIVAFRTSVSV
jgi:hypothetical protein